MAEALTGEELDTKFMIQAKKAANFILTSPSGDPRDQDTDFQDKLKDTNTLSLIDFDETYGTIYIGMFLYIEALFIKLVRLYFMKVS